MKLILGYGDNTEPVLSGSFYKAESGYSQRVTLEERATRVMSDCVVSRLSVVVSRYLAGSTGKLTLRKNGANTALGISVVGGATGAFENLSDSVAFSDGDTASLLGEAEVYANFSSVTMLQEFSAGSPLEVRRSIGEGVTTGSSSQQYYAPYDRTQSLRSAISPDVLLRIEQPGLLKSIMVWPTSNEKSADVEFQAVVNGSPVGSPIIIPAGSRSVFRDTTLEVALSAGDELTFVTRFNGGTGLFALGTFSYSIFQDGSEVEYPGRPGQSSSPGVDQYLALTTPSIYRTVAWHADSFMPCDGFVRGFRAISSSTPSTGFTLVLQKNGIDTGLSVSISSNGEVETSGDPVPFLSGDRLRFRLPAHDGLVALELLAATVGTDEVDPPVDNAVAPAAGSLLLDGLFPNTQFGVSSTPGTGELAIAGLAPSLSEFSGVNPERGQITIEAAAPWLEASLVLDLPAGALRVVGKSSAVYVGLASSPASGTLQVEGYEPVLSFVRGVSASQIASLSLVLPDRPPTRASQVSALALAEPPPPPVRASQAAILTIGEIVPDVLASQMATLVLGHGSACVTERCQIWKITRRDGRVFRYTSHDRPVFYGGQTYSACRSLNPSASENASTLGSVGNMELLGIIDDEGISEADLYGGLFDDAFVTVDLITWGRGTEVPRRLAAGWTGSLSQGETGFKMEVLGPGARLEQQALVQMVTPGCRWVFGSKECGVDVEALKLAGAVVSANTRGAFVATLPASPAERQWENGRVRWTSGVNAGQITETKTVDFETGQVVLWASTGFLPEPGDTFDLIPGCDFNRDGGCTVYANVINFGGFPDLPGADAILETPVAKY